MARIAVLLGPEYQDEELSVPLERLREAGHVPEILGTERDAALRGKHGRTTVTVERAIRDASVADYDALLIPGGRSPSHLRLDRRAIRFVRDFVASEKPIAAVCHGPQLLVDAAVLRGREMTSWPEVRPELEAAGARWIDREVVVDGSFITSRGPEDLEAFSQALIDRLQGASTGSRPRARLGME